MKSICFATPEFEPLTQVGGIGTHYSALTKLLSKNGWEVTVLFFPRELQHRNRIVDENQEAHNVRICDAVALGDVAGGFDKPIQDLQQFALKRSQVMHNALQVLTDERGGPGFDLIEFPDGGGTGFIPVQMRRNDRAYQESRIIVKLHGPWEWAESECPSLTLADLKRYYLEQYSFENADIQVSSSNYLLNWCRQRGWRIRSDASVSRLNPGGIASNDASDNLTGRSEIVFFGAFIERKGVQEFIEALRYIAEVDRRFPDRYGVSFIGKTLSAAFHQDTINRLDKYEVHFLTFPTREEAINYIQKNARLVVIPSRIDNSPSTILECMLSRIPFITSRAGGIPEMLDAQSKLYESVSCSIDNPRNLPTLIQRYLKQNEKYVYGLLDLAYTRGRSITDPERILHWYEERIREPNGLPQTAQQRLEPITIIIHTKNNRKYLETTLNSLLNQTYKNFKLVINESNDGSKRLLDLEQAFKKFPNAKLLQKDNFSPGEALNQVLSYVDTKYFIEMDDDNIAKPNMVETFVRAIGQRKDVAVLSSYCAKFTNADETQVLDSLKSRANMSFTPRWHFEPIGPCMPVLFFENTQGDANSIYLTEAVRSVGGWPEGKNYAQDYGLLLKLAAAGYTLDVIPEVLYYYRVHEGSWSTELKSFRNNAKLGIIESINETHPDLLLRHYRSLHKLIVHSQQTDEAAKSVLYLLNLRLAKFSAEFPRFRRLLESSGKILRRTFAETPDSTY